MDEHVLNCPAVGVEEQQDLTITRPAVSAAAPPVTSALIIEVPEADRVVGQWRQQLDQLAPVGVPAHVTCLFPFPMPHALTTRDVDRIAAAAARTRCFEYRFSHCAWFGESVLWLAPDDPQPFRQLTESLTSAFPQLRPYEGRFDRVIPHLTVGHKCPPERLRCAQQSIEPRLPVTGVATALSLFVPRATGWECTARFELS